MQKKRMASYRGDRRTETGAYGFHSPAARAYQEKRVKEIHREFRQNFWRHQFVAPPVEVGPGTNLCSALGPQGVPCFGYYDDTRHV